MIIGAIATHQPNETLDYDVDCTPMFNGETDTVASATVVLTPNGPASATVIVANDSSVKIWLIGGGSEGDYSLELNVLSAGGRTKQDEIPVSIKEFV